MKQSDLLFAARALSIARRAIPERLAVLRVPVAAQACLETGWGRGAGGNIDAAVAMIGVNNWLGIKPVGDQARHPDRPELRLFRVPEDCFRSWLYLVEESSGYASCRGLWATDLQAWMHDFAAIYCPGNPRYFADWINIARQITVSLVRKEVKTDMKLLKTKTFWGSIAGIATGIGLIVAGDISSGAQLVGASVLAIFLRDGIRKAEK